MQLLVAVVFVFFLNPQPLLHKSIALIFWLH